MTATIMNLPLNEQQEIVHMLARLLYVNYSESEFAKKPMDPPPFCPKWAYRYAQVAVDYLGWDDDTVERLRNDYR